MHSLYMPCSSNLWLHYSNYTWLRPPNFLKHYVPPKMSKTKFHIQIGPQADKKICYGSKHYRSSVPSYFLCIKFWFVIILPIPHFQRIFI
jgi:hypothetical protein